LKVASSIDGRIAAASGVRTPVTSLAARRRVQYDRAWVDAVAVGSETLLVDDPELTARDVFRERPLTRVVFDRRLRTPVAARLLATVAAGPVIIVTTREALAGQRSAAAALERAGATLLAPLEAGIAAALQELPRHGVHSLLVEGGTRLHAAFWDARVVDYVQLYVAPTPLGDAGVPIEPRAFSTASLFERRVDVVGPDVLIAGYVHRPH
jgi:diaminohydroxyphosphoribosylaminopyrimidine deaminase/5-amino-6-(5-phosphoribosylamino)uracil reductase